MKIKGTYSFLLCIGLGILMGKFMLDQYNIEEEAYLASKTNSTVYFIEEGTYKNKEEMEENVTNVEYYIYREEEGVFYTYLGMTQKDENVKIISFSRNFGHQAAVTAGLKNVSGEEMVLYMA